jgi:asparagine synthase (glutamine-hydrolysing)
MKSHSNRFVLVYNGEIYNHKQIKTELEKDDGKIDWKGHSDTEILIEAIERWGIDDTVTRLNGMFAFALWDRKKQILYLVETALEKSHFTMVGKMGALFSHQKLKEFVEPLILLQ